MKSIFTRPLFINPQAYLTIPELSYIQMATPFDFTEDSYSFVINTFGRIEGKLLKTSNDYILHLDLYSIDGNCVLGEFYLNNSELNTDNFNLTQSKNIITLQFGEQSSGNITYPGLIAAWSAKGKTNNDEDRAILKDLTGNGHDITLNGFAFNTEGSGYGGYTTNFSKWIKGSGGIYNIVNDYKINLLSSSKIKQALLYTGINISTMKIKKQKYKVQGLKENQSIILGSDTLNITILEITTDGEYDIDWTKNENRSPCIMCGFVGECDITIEVVPYYPDALVFDGVDDNGICINIPQFNKVDGYTIIMKRIWLREQNGKDAYLAAKNDKSYTQAAFCFDGEQIKGKYTNFGDHGNNLGTGYRAPLISWQTSKMMNSKTIGLGNAEDIGNKFHLGRARENYNIFTNFAFYSAYLFDRSLDEQEIKSFIRKYIDPEYLLPSEIPTPDCYYDFSKGSNDDETR